MKKEINGVRKIPEFRRNNLEEKFDNAKKNGKADSDIQENYEYQTDLKYVQDQLAKLIDRSPQNNLRIDEIKNTNVETWNDCGERVQDLFAQLDGIETVHVHQVKLGIWKGEG